MPGFELFGEKERESVARVLDTGVLMRYGFDGMRQGRYMARELESALERRMRSTHAHLVSSGTAALTVALASAGVGAGDEVILPTFTFVASFEAVMTVGAVPVLVNVDDTLTLDPVAVEAAITKKTRVVMPVHMCGSMADMGALEELCARHRLLLIEDACQAIGGTYAGKPLGSLGDIGCFSFDYVKTITCGEGGAMITDNEGYYRNAERYSDHGHDHSGPDRGAESHPFLGYNYRISELNAAVGLAQLARLNEFLSVQEKNYTALYNALQNIPDIRFRRVPESGVQNYSFISFFLPSAEKAQHAHKALVSSGVDSCFYWFQNNWHYHSCWEHLKGLKTLGRPITDVRVGLPDFCRADFSQSDHWVGRNISCLIKLGWTPIELENRCEKIMAAIRAIL